MELRENIQCSYTWGASPVSQYTIIQRDVVQFAKFPSLGVRLRFQTENVFKTYLASVNAVTDDCCCYSKEIKR